MRLTSELFCSFGAQAGLFCVGIAKPKASTPSPSISCWHLPFRGVGKHVIPDTLPCAFSDVLNLLQQLEDMFPEALFLPEVS